MSTVTETPAQALERITSGFSKNDIAVVFHFAGVGVDPDDIEPRENVLTFKAWKAKGRKVAKSAISQRITVWVPKSRKAGESDDSKDKSQSCFPKTTCVFHESQTLTADAPKGARPDAWQNPELIRPGTYTAD